MATCTQCGAELKPGTKFCENCGAKVSVPQPAAQPEAAATADAAAAPAEQPAETTETTEPAAPADDDKAADSSEDFWAKDESQLKLDPPPADMKPDEPDYDAFQGVKFSE